MLNHSFPAVAAIIDEFLQLTPRLSGLPSPAQTPHTAYFHIDEPEVVTSKTYDLPVDHNQFDRATKIKPSSMLRPHMRIFYLSWMSGIMGFIGWYAIPPLMPVIKTQLGLTEGEVLNSDIASTASTIFSRIASGPLLDRFGPQVVQSSVLWFGAIPIVCAAFVNSATCLLIVRFFVGLVGCVFVSSQYWTTITFARNVAGTANAITGGLGLSGIGFAFLVLPFVTRPSLQAVMCRRSGLANYHRVAGRTDDYHGTVIRFAVDSCPTGDFQALMNTKRQAEQNGRAAPARISISGSSSVLPVTQPHAGEQHRPMGMLQSFRIVLTDLNVLVMIAQYAACFGTELQLNNMGALYFYTQFTKNGCTPTDSNICYLLSKTNAATVASSFGLMNMFARALGGLASDAVNHRLGMRGRQRVQFTLLCVLGALVIILSQLDSLGACVALYVLVAIAAQATGGSTYGIVPYLNEEHTGTVNGLVGAGGNLGGVIYGIIFRSTDGYSTGLLYTGIIILACALLTPLLRFPHLQQQQETDVHQSSDAGDASKRSHSTMYLEDEPYDIFVQVDRHEEAAHAKLYDLPVDSKQFDRATTIKPTSMLRPHMRIFYLSWMSAITGFFGWYAIPPLMPVIKTQLGLTDGEVLNSDIASTASTIFSRIASGPLLDRFGPQAVQSAVLWLGAIPILCAAFINSATTLLAVRFVVGLVGCVFVTSQYWTTITFARNVAGAANAITGGLGLSGIGFAFLLLPFVFKAITSSGHVSEDLGWRITIALPAVLMIIMGVVIRFAVDSCPTGDFQELMTKKRQAEQQTANVAGSIQEQKMKHPSLRESFKIVLSDPNVLIMIAHYAACFGTELQLNNMGALYFYKEFIQKGCTDSMFCSVLSKTSAATCWNWGNASAPLQEREEAYIPVALARAQLGKVVADMHAMKAEQVQKLNEILEHYRRLLEVERFIYTLIDTVVDSKQQTIETKRAESLQNKLRDLEAKAKAACSREEILERRLQAARERFASMEAQAVRETVELLVHAVAVTIEGADKAPPATSDAPTQTQDVEEEPKEAEEAVMVTDTEGPTLLLDKNSYESDVEVARERNVALLRSKQELHEAKEKLENLTKAKKVVKTAVKTWFTAFQSQFGREPTIEDKAQVKDKYLAFKDAEKAFSTQKALVQTLKQQHRELALRIDASSRWSALGSAVAKSARTARIDDENGVESPLVDSSCSTSEQNSQAASQAASRPLLASVSTQDVGIEAVVLTKESGTDAASDEFKDEAVATLEEELQELRSQLAVANAPQPAIEYEDKIREHKPSIPAAPTALPSPQQLQGASAYEAAGNPSYVEPLVHEEAEPVSVVGKRKPRVVNKSLIGSNSNDDEDESTEQTVDDEKEEPEEDESQEVKEDAARSLQLVQMIIDAVARGKAQFNRGDKAKCYQTYAKCAEKCMAELQTLHDKQRRQLAPALKRVMAESARLPPARGPQALRKQLDIVRDNCEEWLNTREEQAVARLAERNGRKEAKAALKKQQILEKKQAEQKNEEKKHHKKKTSPPQNTSNGTPLGDGKALEDAKQKLRALEAKAKADRVKISQLEAALAKAETQVGNDNEKAAKKEIAALTQQLQAAQKASQELQDQTSALQKELGVAGGKAKQLGQLELEVNQLREQAALVTPLNNELRDAKAQYTTLETSYREEQALRKKYYNQIEDMKGKIRSAVDGYNVCIFAYGQTGSGKTFTMTGSEGDPGLSPRAIHHLFQLAEEGKSNFTVTFQATMLELYNDSLIDLFHLVDGGGAHDNKLEIKKNEKGMVVVQNATLKKCTTPEQTLRLFEAANKKRQVGATKMNAESSRSHSIFSLLVESYNKTTKATTIGKLSLVDLAGSERAGKTGATADRLKEAQAINKSLSAHVREYLASRLQPGTAPCLGFVVVDFSAAHFSSFLQEETSTSLTYASRVKLITNSANKNSESEQVNRLKAIIKQLRAGKTDVDLDGVLD
ncbi:P-loop containing nucleoside triphosphate hydrolase [Phytophthora cactorum]|nr:P-loop containing nucleoside triphosphate hydrolase [Phytophthora cactorum]